LRLKKMIFCFQNSGEDTYFLCIFAALIAQFAKKPHDV